MLTHAGSTATTVVKASFCVVEVFVGSVAVTLVVAHIVVRTVVGCACGKNVPQNEVQSHTPFTVTLECLSISLNK